MISERTTASRHSPSYVHRSDHALHHRAVASMAASASTAAGSGPHDEYQASVNGTRCPAVTVKSASV